MLGVANFDFENKGDTRIIIYETIYSEFTLMALEHLLEEGETIRVTIDNFDIFAAYTIHKDNQLSENSKSVLATE